MLAITITKPKYLFMICLAMLTTSQTLTAAGAKPVILPVPDLANHLCHFGFVPQLGDGNARRNL